jgi:hypothetical protein
MIAQKEQTKVRTQQPIAEPAPAPDLPAVISPPSPPPTFIPAPPAATVRDYPGRLAKAILSVAKEIGSIQKQGFNEFQRYRYTRWEDINDKLSPLLADYGLIITQREVAKTLYEPNDKGSTLAVTYAFSVINEHGDQWPEIELTGMARFRDQKGIVDDKASSKCLTMAEKSFCVKLFKIRSDDSIDPDDERRPQRAADERVTYQKYLDEINAIHSLAELDQWKKNNLERVRSALRDHWLGYFNVAFTEKRADLSNAYATMPDFDAETGEVVEDAAPQQASSVSAAPKAAPPHRNPAAGAAEKNELTTDEADATLTAAASHGMQALLAAWGELTAEHKASLRSALERRHKMNAMKADAAPG